MNCTACGQSMQLRIGVEDHLIAAVPDMLALLQRLVNMTNIHYGDMDSPDAIAIDASALLARLSARR